MPLKKDSCWIYAGLLGIGLLAWALRVHAGPVGATKTVELPEKYPEHWVFVHDIVNFQMLNERVILFDADSGQFVGQINAALLAQFKASRTRPEFYVVETFYERGTRGKRTDVVSIYDRRTLSPVGEVFLPGAKRIITVPEDHLAELIDDGRFLLITNFSPAQSVTVVDLTRRTVVNEIFLPSCNMVYPTGARGFSSLCADGAMMTYVLDATGQVVRESRLEGVVDIEKDPLFEKAAIVNGVAHFPSFKGRMQPIDLRGETPVVGKAWELIQDDGETQANYRPGGWQLIGQHAGDGEIYVLMHQQGFDGSHKEPGQEVWVFDPARMQRLRRIHLKDPGVSINVTGDDAPLLLVVNIQGSIDVYEARSGQHQRRLEGIGLTPHIFYNVPELRPH